MHIGLEALEGLLAVMQHSRSRVELEWAVCDDSAVGPAILRRPRDAGHVVGKSGAELKVRQDLSPPAAPAGPQARKRPRPPDPGGKAPTLSPSLSTAAPEEAVSFLDPSDRAWLRQSLGG